MTPTLFGPLTHAAPVDEPRIPGASKRAVCDGTGDRERERDDERQRNEQEDDERLHGLSFPSIDPTLAHDLNERNTTLVLFAPP